MRFPRIALVAPIALAVLVGACASSKGATPTLPPLPTVPGVSTSSTVIATVPVVPTVPVATAVPVTTTVPAATTLPAATTTTGVATTTTATTVPSGSTYAPREKAETWIMQLASAATDATDAAIRAQLQKFAQTISSVNAMRTTDWPRTFPGDPRVIFYVGGFASQDAVIARCGQLGLAYPTNCLARFLTEK